MFGGLNFRGSRTLFNAAQFGGRMDGSARRAGTYAYTSHLGQFARNHPRTAIGMGIGGGIGGAALVGRASGSRGLRTKSSAPAPMGPMY